MPPLDDIAPSGAAGFFGTAGVGGLPATPPPILKVLRRVPAIDARDVDPQALIEITSTLPIRSDARARP
jgi:hypothetical protein